MTDKNYRNVETNSSNSEESKFDEESLRNAYANMDSQWLSVQRESCLGK